MPARGTRRCCSATTLRRGTSPTAPAPTPGRSSRASARACRASTSRVGGWRASSRALPPGPGIGPAEAIGSVSIPHVSAVPGGLCVEPGEPYPLSTRVKSVSACQACGSESSKWLGRCPDCGDWNCFVEERQEAASSARAKGPGPALGGRPQPYDMVDGADAERIATGLGEFDRVLGGGIVPGSMILIGGEPGIGKSSLLLQVAHLLGRNGGTVLYVSGEESERQIKLRGARFGVTGGGLYLMGETSLERILEQVDELKPSALVVDSVQTVYSSKFPS